MPFLYIAEFRDLAVSVQGVIAAPQMPPLAPQKLDFGAGAAPSAPFSAGTKFVEVHADAPCSIRFSPAGAPANATIADMRLAANETRRYGVIPGGTVSVIANP